MRYCVISSNEFEGIDFLMYEDIQDAMKSVKELEIEGRTVRLIDFEERTIGAVIFE